MAEFGKQSSLDPLCFDTPCGVDTSFVYAVIHGCTLDVFSRYFLDKRIFLFYRDLISRDKSVGNNRSKRVGFRLKVNSSSSKIS